MLTTTSDVPPPAGVKRARDEANEENELPRAPPSSYELASSSSVPTLAEPMRVVAKPEEAPPPIAEVKAEEPAAAVKTDNSATAAPMAAPAPPPLDECCPIAPVPGAADPDPGPVIPRSEFQFTPKCGHRHPLKRSSCAAGSAAADDEPLLCDGACGKEIRPSEPRWSCYPCDYDLCELCLLSRSGGAAYLGLLAAEEAKVAAASDKARALAERARDAEAKLTAAERAVRESKSDHRAGGAQVVAERKALEAKVRSTEERAAESEAEVARLQKEVVERRQRSKANLEKMYAAQKERDEARALIGVSDEANAAKLAAQTAATEEAQRQLGAARQQLACAFGDDDALSKMSSRDELESLQTALIGALQRINARCRGDVDTDALVHEEEGE